ncbi:type II toxin-antitoxin system RelB/DinJ family antitoxin [Pyramidobacter sp. YE332]|uniref:type II toxin-antitoxin system RelB/DinJ family antitoxin n=1 Tax=Pyramidobacter sp. YE332 TaxID=3068894 RepID=UPI00294AA8F7|nr:type II toxin-antitoxin system RelB/DinJ family antitoxin [Pyramidobacter sp. YE332]WOL40668.1 type II toxin-antitoxin system RelB/DinJ family antitoxin [Pyramidobacter sp. YE332]
MALATMSVRVDEDTKKQVEAFCADVGMNPSTAVNLFFKAMLRENRIPFEIERDPFYAPANMAHLRRSVAQAEAGRLTPTN